MCEVLKVSRSSFYNWNRERYGSSHIAKGLEAKV